ncbi:unnamed protein product [Spodoptera exigua]|nr:unnamed protein product [Spodoptera exigua]
MAALPGSKSSCTSFAALAEPCGCTISKESFDPLCGSDGATYLNQCFLECEKMLSNIDIKVHHKAVHKPVCGNNHVTYANICVLHCYATKDSSIRFMKMGDCSGDGNGPRLVSRFGTGGKWKDKTLLRVRHFRG